MTDVQSKLQSIGQLPGWHGQSVQAARQKFTITADDISDEIATVSAVQELARQTAVAVEHLQSELKELEIDAAANEMTLHDDGQVTYSTEGKRPDAIEQLERTELQIEAAARALLRKRRTSIPMRRQCYGRRRARSMPVMLEPPKRSNGSGANRPASQPIQPAPRFTPLESKEYWDALSPEQKSFVLSQHLQWVPNVDGIPATVRDEANRAMIPIERTRLEAERKLLRDKIDDNLFRASFNNDDARLWLRVCCHVTRTRRSSIRAGVDDAVFYGSPVAGPR